MYYTLSFLLFKDLYVILQWQYRLFWGAASFLCKFSRQYSSHCIPYWQLKWYAAENLFLLLPKCKTYQSKCNQNSSYTSLSAVHHQQSSVPDRRNDRQKRPQEQLPAQVPVRRFPHENIRKEILQEKKILQSALT